MPLSAFDPKQYDRLFAEKCDRVNALLAPYSPPEPECFSSGECDYRMRAEFRLWHDGDKLDYVMYRVGDPKTPRDAEGR